LASVLSFAAAGAGAGLLTGLTAGLCGGGDEVSEGTRHAQGSERPPARQPLPPRKVRYRDRLV
jgi:hypothetical protein